MNSKSFSVSPQTGGSGQSEGEIARDMLEVKCFMLVSEGVSLAFLLLPVLLWLLYRLCRLYVLCFLLLLLLLLRLLLH